MADSVVKSRPLIKPELLELLFSVKPSDYTLQLAKDWFAAKKNNVALMPPEGTIKITQEFSTPPTGVKAGEFDSRFASNWKEIKETTPGRIFTDSLIFSRSKELRETFPFHNGPWDGRHLEGLQQRAVDKLLEGKIVYEDISWTINALTWLGYSITSFITPSLTINTLRLPKETARQKRREIASRKDELLGDPLEATKLRDELIKQAEDELKGNDPGFEIYASGARGSFSNNYGNTAVMRGPIAKSDDGSKLTVSLASLKEGIPKEEIQLYSDIMTQASYQRSVGTRDGGYLSKQLAAAFATIRFSNDEKSDCKTPYTIEETLKNPKDFRYRFYMVGNKAVEILPENEEKLKGKTVKLRTPLFCREKGHICHVCAGSLYRRMGVENTGLLAWRAGSVLLNASLKAFHDSSIKTIKLKIEDFIKKI